MPILPILGIIFVTLKVTNLLDWSWWWVLSPFYPMALIYLVIAILATIGTYSNSRRF